MTGGQILLPIMMQSKRLVEKNITLVNCWTGLATNEVFDSSGFCLTCRSLGACKALYHFIAGRNGAHPSRLARYVCRIFDIKNEYMRTKADLETYYLVLDRESAVDGRVRCLLCNARAADVHEIMPKSWFGKTKEGECFALDNRCCLCRKCHEGAVSDLGRGELLYLMSNRYRYEYKDSVRQWLIENYQSTIQSEKR